MTDEELKALVASNAQGLNILQQSVSEMRAGIDQMQVGIDQMRIGLEEIKQFQQNEAREWRQAMRASYEDMVRMLTQFAEESTADRQSIRDLIAAMFRHQSNGGGQSQQSQ